MLNFAAVIISKTQLHNTARDSFSLMSQKLSILEVKSTMGVASTWNQCKSRVICICFKTTVTCLGRCVGKNVKSDLKLEKTGSCLSKAHIIMFCFRNYSRLSEYSIEHNRHNHWLMGFGLTMLKYCFSDTYKSVTKTESI